MIIKCQMPSEYFLHNTLLTIILLHMLAISYFNFTGFDTGLENEELEPLLASFEEAQTADRNFRARFVNFMKLHFNRQQNNDRSLHGLFVLIQGVLDIFKEEDFKENITYFPKIIQEVRKCSKKKALFELDLRRAKGVVAQISDYHQKYLREVFDTKQSDMEAVFEYNRLDPHEAGITEQRMLGLLTSIVSGQREVWWSILEGQMFSARALGHTDSWKKTRSIQLAAELHAHLDAVMHMRGCDRSPQVICHFSPSKFSSEVHKVTYCLAVAYITRRTIRVKSTWGLTGCVKRQSNNYVTWRSLLSTVSWRQGASYASVLELSKGKFDIVVNADDQHPHFLPDFFPAVFQPSFIRRIRDFHKEPEVWLVGQMVDYILRPLKFKADLNREREEIGFRHPIVGLYLHSADNTSQSLRLLTEHVAGWSSKGKSEKKRVFVVAISLDLFNRTQTSHPEYTFIQRRKSAKSDAPTRETSFLDAYLLSRCDYLVCSFKWNLCRLAYELMQTARGDYSDRAVDLSQKWFFGGFKAAT